ncbi:S41 family peptidase, partial [Alistipes communis]
MYKNSRSTVLLPLVVAAAVALGIFLGQFLGRSSAESDIKGILRSLALPQNKVSQTLSLIETQYVDSVAIDSLVERALPVIVSELDPHSVYIPASEMAEINEPLDGEFDGIGVVFNMATDTVIVLNVIPSGPSDKAGVVAGDRIVRINDSLVAGQQIPQREIMRRLRGKRGSEVRLGLERRGIDELVEVTVVRDKIPIRSLTAALMLTGDIAFVKLDQFARTSHTELLEALSTLRTQGMRKLILDLRGNSGGFLDQAIAIANEFLPADKLIVYTEDRNHQRIKQYSDGTGSAADLDLAVLVDEGSASSSEILAGALQDNDR